MWQPAQPASQSEATVTFSLIDLPILLVVTTTFAGTAIPVDVSLHGWKPCYT